MSLPLGQLRPVSSKSGKLCLRSSRRIESNRMQYVVPRASCLTEVRRKAIGRAYVWRCALIQSTSSSNLNSQGCVQLLMSFRYWCYPEQERGSCCRLVEVVNGGDTELVTKLIRKDHSDPLHFFLLVLPLTNTLQARFYSFFCQAHPCLSIFRGTSCLNLNSLVFKLYPFHSLLFQSYRKCWLPVSSVFLPAHTWSTARPSSLA